MTFSIIILYYKNKKMKQKRDRLIEVLRSLHITTFYILVLFGLVLVTTTSGMFLAQQYPIWFVGLQVFLALLVSFLLFKQDHPVMNSNAWFIGALVTSLVLVCSWFFAALFINRNFFFLCIVFILIAKSNDQLVVVWEFIRKIVTKKNKE